MADPRLTPRRADLPADRAPRRHLVATAAAPLTATPDAEAPMTTQLLLGEGFAAHHAAGGWLWGQSEPDGYVGYAPEACFRPDDGRVPTHRVTALQALVYPAPSIKTRPLGALPLGARLRAGPAEGGFHALEEDGWVCAQALGPADAAAPDWVAQALRFLGAPYLWGGRTAAGIDCSGLVQVARQAAGFACLRDSDMQAAAPGRDVAEGSERRGDLIFWSGHVGVMLDRRRLLHATAHAMAVTIEPLAAVEARIAAAGHGPAVARRRWPARVPSRGRPGALSLNPAQ